MISDWQYHSSPRPGVHSKPVVDAPALTNHDGLRLHWKKQPAMEGRPVNDFHQLDSKGIKRCSVDEPQMVSKRQKV